MNEQVKSQKLTATTKAINKKVNEENSNNSQGLAHSSLGTTSILPNSDALSLSESEAKYIGLIGKELLLGVLDRRFPIPNNCEKVNANQPVTLLHRQSNYTPINNLQKYTAYLVIWMMFICHSNKEAIQPLILVEICATFPMRLTKSMNL